MNLTSWTELDQRSLAWGSKLFPDDHTSFPTTGVCASYDDVVHQYTSQDHSHPFTDIRNHSCLNSWTGGNIAARPLDVARFAWEIFGTEELIDAKSRKEMNTLHPFTDGNFGAYAMAYGLGMEASFDASGARPNKICGFDYYGHGGLDYGSGAEVNGFLTGLNLGFSLAMNSAVQFGDGVAGMACDRDWGSLRQAYNYALTDVLNALAEYAGVASYPCGNTTGAYDPPPAASCVDAESFGTMNGHPVNCKTLTWEITASPTAHLDTEKVCSYVWERHTLADLEGLFAQGDHPAKYEPPPGYNPNTTVAIELCKATCMAAGIGPCWLRGPVTPWCGSAAPDQTIVSDAPYARPPLPRHIRQKAVLAEFKAATI